MEWKVHRPWSEMEPLTRYLNISTLSFLFPEMGESAWPCRSAARVCSVQCLIGVGRVKKKIDRKSGLVIDVYLVAKQETFQSTH